MCNTTETLCSIIGGDWQASSLHFSHTFPHQLSVLTIKAQTSKSTNLRGKNPLFQPNTSIFVPKGPFYHSNKQVANCKRSPNSQLPLPLPGRTCIKPKARLARPLREARSSLASLAAGVLASCGRPEPEGVTDQVLCLSMPLGLWQRAGLRGSPPRLSKSLPTCTWYPLLATDSFTCTSYWGRPDAQRPPSFISRWLITFPRLS